MKFRLNPIAIPALIPALAILLFTFDNHVAAQLAQLEQIDSNLNPSEAAIAEDNTLNDARTLLNAQNQRNNRQGVNRARAADPFGQRQPTTRQNGFGSRGVSNFGASQATTESMERAKKIAVLTMDLRRTTEDDHKKELKAELQTQLEAQYDSYLEQHEAPLKKMEERLAKLRKDFEWRKSAKDDLVKLRLDTIWYDTQGLGWPNQNNIRVQQGNQTFPVPVFGGQSNFATQNSFGNQNNPFGQSSPRSNDPSLFGEQAQPNRVQRPAQNRQSDSFDDEPLPNPNIR